MCVQEEDRLKAQNGGSLNYVKDNKKKELHSKQQWLSFKAIWKGKSSNAVSALAQADSSGQRSVELQEDWALQERLP
jgi:hypothetical protein